MDLLWISGRSDRLTAASEGMSPGFSGSQNHYKTILKWYPLVN